MVGNLYSPFPSSLKNFKKANYPVFKKNFLYLPSIYIIAFIITPCVFHFNNLKLTLYFISIISNAAVRVIMISDLSIFLIMQLIWKHKVLTQNVSTHIIVKNTFFLISFKFRFKYNQYNACVREITSISIIVII